MKDSLWLRDMSVFIGGLAGQVPVKSSRFFRNKTASLGDNDGKSLKPRSWSSSEAIQGHLANDLKITCVDLRPLQTNPEKQGRFSRFILAERTKIQGRRVPRNVWHRMEVEKRDAWHAVCVWLPGSSEQTQTFTFGTQSGDWLNMFIAFSWRHPKKVYLNEAGDFPIFSMCSRLDEIKRGTYVCRYKY